MAYVSGTAANFQDLKTAIESASTSSGWSLNSGILSKGAAFVQIVANPTTGTTPAPATQERYKIIAYPGTGQSGSTLTGGDPLDGACIGNPQSTSTSAARINFPVTYEIYSFNNPDEVHCVINYNSDFYQFLAFGVSDIPGIGGTGLWVTGSFGRAFDAGQTAGLGGMCYMVAGSGNVATDPYGGIALPYFFKGRADSGAAGNMTGSIHCGLDGATWCNMRGLAEGTTSPRVYGVSTVAGLLTSLPSPYNQAAVLLPVRIVKQRLNNGSTIVANIRNARFTRNDNIRPGEVVSYGAERWKVYPIYRRDTVNRHGVTYSTGSLASGTFAVALRYEGP